MDHVGPPVIIEFAEPSLQGRQHLNVVDKVAILFVELMHKTRHIVVLAGASNDMRDRFLPEANESAIVPVEEIGQRKVLLVIYFFHRGDLLRVSG